MTLFATDAFPKIGLYMTSMAIVFYSLSLIGTLPRRH